MNQGSISILIPSCNILLSLLSCIMYMCHAMQYIQSYTIIYVQIMQCVFTVCIYDG